MANDFYNPRPTFLDHFTQGIGLGLSMRQASDRAKQIEIESQKQKMLLDQYNQENTARQKLSDYANTPSAQTPGEMNLELTGEAQANQQINPGIRPDNAGIAPDSPDYKNDITGVQGVYEAPTGGEKPTLRMMLEKAVGLGVGPRQLQAIAGALRATDPRLASGGSVSRAFATSKEALDYQNSDEFKQAFPYGARLTQTSRGWQFAGLNPSNPADNIFHQDIAQGVDRNAALANRERVLYGGSSATTAGNVLGRAAAETGQPTPPFPQQGQPAAPVAPTGVAPGVAAPAPVAAAPTGVPLPQQAAAAMAGAKTTGKETAEMNLPLRDKAPNYIEPVGLTPAPPDMTEAEAIKRGYRTFSGKSPGQFVTMARSAFGILDRLEELSNKLLLPEKSGAAARAKNWAEIKSSKYIGDNPDVKEFYGLLGSQLATFAKAAGDAANIAVPEQEFQKEFLPDGFMSREVAKQIIQSRRNLLRGTLDAALGNKAIPQAGQSGSSGLPPGWKRLEK
jgi:hypothetical protein